MRNKRILVRGLAVLLVLGIGLGLHLKFRSAGRIELPQIKDEAPLKELISLPKEPLSLEEAKIEEPTKVEPASSSQIKEEKEPEYLTHLREAGIEVKEFKNLPAMGKVVTEHQKKLGYPKVEAEFAEKLPQNYIPGEIIVKRLIYKEGDAYEISYDRLTVPPGQELQTISELKREPEVISAKLNRKIEIQQNLPPTITASLQVVPQTQSISNADPGFPQQWGLKQIKADEAWDIEKGKDSVKIAVIDTGADLNHPDLIHNLDLAESYDFVNDDNEPQDDNVISKGHGTHVTGIIGAEGFNGLGVHGVMNKAKLVIYKALDEKGDGQSDVLGEAIAQALDDGANIINMSWGTKDDLKADIGDILDAAFASDALLVTAAGNHKEPGVLYPCKYAEVLCVAGTDNNDSRWVSTIIDTATGTVFESAYGPEVDVSAPAEDIYSTILDDTYGNLSGTSMSAPFVAGLAGLLLSKDPTLTEERLIELIKDNVDPVTGDNAAQMGTGRINALKAIEAVGGGANNNPPAARIKAEPREGEPPLEVQFDGSESSDSDGQIVEYRWDFADGTITNTVGDKPTHIYETRRKYVAKLTVKDDKGATGTASINIYVGVPVETILKGKVTMAGTQDGIADVLVKAEKTNFTQTLSAQSVPSYSTRTNSSGSYELPIEMVKDEVTDVIVEASKDGFNLKREVVEDLGYTEERILNLELAPVGGGGGNTAIIYGKVTVFFFDAPIGAQIEVRKPGDDFKYTTTADKDGYYWLRVDLPNSAQVFEVEAKVNFAGLGYKKKTTTRALKLGDRLNLNLVLDADIPEDKICVVGEVTDLGEGANINYSGSATRILGSRTLDDKNWGTEIKEQWATSHHFLRQGGKYRIVVDNIQGIPKAISAKATSEDFPGQGKILNWRDWATKVGIGATETREIQKKNPDYQDCQRRISCGPPYPCDMKYPYYCEPFITETKTVNYSGSGEVKEPQGGLIGGKTYLLNIELNSIPEPKKYEPKVEGEGGVVNQLNYLCSIFPKLPFCGITGL